jgi:hypothetical protein
MRQRVVVAILRIRTSSNYVSFFWFFNAFFVGLGRKFTLKLLEGVTVEVKNTE